MEIILQEEDEKLRKKMLRKQRAEERKARRQNAKKPKPNKEKPDKEHTDSQNGEASGQGEKEQKRALRAARKAEKKETFRKLSTGMKVLVIIARVLLIVLTVVSAIAIGVGTFVWQAGHWALDTWGNLSMDEMMFQLKSGVTGADHSFLQEFLTHTVLVAVLAVLGLLVLVFLLRRKRFLTIPLRIVAIILAVVLGVTTVKLFWEEVSIDEYIEAQTTYSSFIDDNYADPVVTPIQFPEKKRNLIYIYLESMEDTFADQESGGAFETNVIPELTKLSMENENFSGSENKLNGAYSLKNTTWTMAAMFAQTSGLPLSIPIKNNDMSAQETFFPGATVLGDILDREGYKQYLMIGSDAVFGGRKLYFTEHGNYIMYDYNYALEHGEIPEDYFVFWGYEDARLFENAKEKLTEISKQDEPFNFTMLTVDTHFEDGYVCDLCEDTFGDDQYANVYACASKQISEFVEWIKEQPFYENTTLILAGDHPTMDHDFCKEIDKEYDRKVYTTYVNAAAEYTGNACRQYSTFDMFPTTLAAMGCEIEGERLGLGTNLFSEEPTLLEEYGRAEVNQGLSAKSELMDNLIGGIVTEHAKLEISDLDMESAIVTLKAHDVVWAESMEGLYFQVTNKDTKQKEIYEPEEISEGVYETILPLTDFHMRGGDFEVDCFSYQAKRSGDVGRAQVVLASGEFRATTAMLSAADPEKLLEHAYREDTVRVTPYDYRVGSFSVICDGAFSLGEWQLLFKAYPKAYPYMEQIYAPELDENRDYTAHIYAHDFGYLNDKYVVTIYAYKGEIERDPYDPEAPVYVDLENEKDHVRELLTVYGEI